MWDRNTQHDNKRHNLKKDKVSCEIQGTAANARWDDRWCPKQRWSVQMENSKIKRSINLASGITVSTTSPERCLLTNSITGFTYGDDIDPRFPTQRTSQTTGKFLEISISLKFSGYDVSLHILIIFQHSIKEVGNHYLKQRSYYTPSTHFQTGLFF
jgi:hypothetical protein